MTSIVTKTGDKGQTGLFGGKRVPKDAPRIQAYGTVDELNATLGITRAEEKISAELSDQLLHIQHLLFRVGGDLATPLEVPSKEERIGQTHVTEIEQWIETIEKDLPAQTRFLLPGGTKVSAQLHLARTVCRRAERWVVSLEKTERINPWVRIFLNRLSDYLFLAARKANVDAGMPETEVEY